METARIAALVIGILAVVAVVYFALWSTGYFQYLGGKKRSSIPPVKKETLIGRLLNLNDLAKPFSIVEGKSTDLIAEWKLADAAWYEAFSEGRIGQAYRAYLLLDEPRHTVRCYEEVGSVKWVMSVNGPRPTVSYRRARLPKSILGKKVKREAGKMPEPKFLITEIRKPIALTVRESGWEWVPVRARRNATFKTSA